MTKIIRNGIEYGGNTDYKVSQTATSNNANYEVLFSGTADNATRTEGAGKSNKLLFNPSTGQLSVDSISVDDISYQYTITKTSGNWKVNEIGAVRSGNTIHMRVEMSGNGSSVSAGSNGFVGTLSGGPLPALSIKLVAFYNNCPIMMNIEPDGAIVARVTATSVTVTSSGTLALTGTFITYN